MLISAHACWQPCDRRLSESWLPFSVSGSLTQHGSRLSREQGWGRLPGRKVWGHILKLRLAPQTTCSHFYWMRGGLAEVDVEIMGEADVLPDLAWCCLFPGLSALEGFPARGFTPCPWPCSLTPQGCPPAAVFRTHSLH